MTDAPRRLGLTRADLAEVRAHYRALGCAGAHMLPVVDAVAAGLAVAQVGQHAGPFRLPDEGEALLLVGDNHRDCLGPGAFYGPACAA